MFKLFPPCKESPIILRDGNGTIYPMVKDWVGGIRDPDWLDLPPINSLGMGVHSLANLPSNSTIKKKAAIIIMAVEVKSDFQVEQARVSVDVYRTWFSVFISMCWSRQFPQNQSSRSQNSLILCLSETDSHAARVAL